MESGPPQASRTLATTIYRPNGAGPFPLFWTEINVFHPLRARSTTGREIRDAEAAIAL